MTIQQQEDRPRHIWRFVAICAPIALILFVSGLIAGKAFQSDVKNCTEKLSQAQQEAFLLREKMGDIQRFFHQTDSLIAAYEVKYDEVTTKLGSIAGDDLNSFNNLEMALIDINGDLNKAFRVLENEYSNSDTLDIAMKSGMNYLDKYAHLYNLKLTKQIGDMKKKAMEGATDELKDLQKVLEQEKKDLEKAKDAAATDAKTKDLESNQKDCEKELNKLRAAMAASAGKDNGGGKNYNAQVEKIMAETNTIRKEILPKIGNGIIGKNKSAKEELSASLTIIAEQVQSIKQ